MTVSMKPLDDVVAAIPGDTGDTGDGADRRTVERLEVTWAVDCQTDETFLYASISNISALGIFVRTTTPLPIGTMLQLRFAPPGSPQFTLGGQVQWVNTLRALGDNPNPGMGIRFLDLSSELREQLVELIRTIAYLRNPQV